MADSAIKSGSDREPDNESIEVLMKFFQLLDRWDREELERKRVTGSGPSATGTAVDSSLASSKRKLVKNQVGKLELSGKMCGTTRALEEPNRRPNTK